MTDASPVIAWSLLRNAGSLYAHDYRRVLLYDRYVVIGERDFGSDQMRYFRGHNPSPEQARENALYITGNLEKDGFVLHHDPMVVRPLPPLMGGRFSILAQLPSVDTSDEDWDDLWDAMQRLGVPLQDPAA